MNFNIFKKKCRPSLLDGRLDPWYNVKNHCKGGNCMRKHYIDNVRWLTVAVVVVYHVIYMFNNLQPFGVMGGFYETQWWDHFLTLVYPWIMVLLFIIAGMSARWSLERRSAKEFARSRTDKLFVPVSLGLLLFHWITGYFNMQISGAFEEMTSGIPVPILYLIMTVSGIGVLWFLQMLWIFSLLLLLVRKLEKDKLWTLCKKLPAWGVLLLGIPLWGAAQILNTPVITVYRFGFYGLAFFIGYFVLSHDEIMEKLVKLWLPLALAASGLGIAEVIVYYGQNYAENPVRDNVLTIIYAWAASLAILTGMKRFGNVRSHFTAWMNARSWGLYIFHYVCLSACAWLMRDLAIPAVLQYLFALTASVGGGYLLGEILSRIPVVRFWILGIRGKKKEKGASEHVQG